jgi:hypothetical protein
MRPAVPMAARSRAAMPAAEPGPRPDSAGNRDQAGNRDLAGDRDPADELSEAVGV